jgi:Zn-dependent M28 family amino/carboxypeptidase
VNFFDVTEHTKWFFSSEDTVIVPKYNFPTDVHHNNTVQSLITQIDKDELHDNLALFSSFFSRYYKSETGRDSAKWLIEKINTIVANSTQTITVKPFKHSWAQFSIIVTIEGESDDTVIVGCHQDSTNLLFPNLMKAPGADDDGSGVTTNLEALRILINSGYKPKNTVEFHFYSAEEGGLLGSLDIFSHYKTQGYKVVSMLQQDMTGYVQKTLDNGVEEHVGVIDDNVNPELTEFVKLVIDSYLSIPWRETQCGYACSDHASALKNGYPSSFIIESEFKYTNPYIHSTSDTLDRLSFDHIAEFTKLVLGYVVELGQHKFKRVDV